MCAAPWTPWICTVQTQTSRQLQPSARCVMARQRAGIEIADIVLDLLRWMVRWIDARLQEAEDPWRVDPRALHPAVETDAPTAPSTNSDAQCETYSDMPGIAESSTTGSAGTELELGNLGSDASGSLHSPAASPAASPVHGNHNEQLSRGLSGGGVYIPVDLGSETVEAVSLSAMLSSVHPYQGAH